MLSDRAELTKFDGLKSGKVSSEVERYAVLRRDVISGRVGQTFVVSQDPAYPSGLTLTCRMTWTIPMAAPRFSKTLRSTNATLPVDAPWLRVARMVARNRFG